MRADQTFQLNMRQLEPVTLDIRRAPLGSTS
jgi:hypothetical protein